MSFSVGSLVKARGREWVVLPESTDELLLLRPLGGTDDESTGILTSLEKIEPASFDLPDTSRIGDHHSCQLLRDAVRLGFRSSAGPFRSLARINVEPRPYQIVPLLMALKLEPVRLLIADDVGIGKTIEACLVARELLDRGDASHLAVLCPPQLAEQWQSELSDKFHIEAELVLPSTASRLESRCGAGQSLFDIYPFVIVSMDFIKAEKRRDDFLRACPELVIVDEAHTCSESYEGKGLRHLRHKLLKGLSKNPNRHLILVTATPHSGKEHAFRSLISLLGAEFEDLPDDLSGKGNEHQRRKLAQHFIQRKRSDIVEYLDTKTPFPKREEEELSYQLSPEYKMLFERVLRYATERVKEPGLDKFRQRVRWWSILGLLRCIASSPAAAAATLRSRSKVRDAESAEAADETGIPVVFDVNADDSAASIDVNPGSDADEEGDNAEGDKRRLREMAAQAESLKGEKDSKLQKGIKIVKQLVESGYRPIVFCRFIETADYVAEELRKQLKGYEVASVTGDLPPTDREERVKELAESERRVLVSTDYLSEGVNLQEHFDAVLHYDLSWNPTRHEQREGRVDRYGQEKEKVKVITYYGTDNQIDGIVLDVLIRKHKAIRNSIGISVPVPFDTNQVIEAIFEGILLREHAGKTTGEQLIMFEEYFKPRKEDLHKQMDLNADREKRSRNMFAQEAIKIDEVRPELDAARSAIGSSVDVERFATTATQLLNGFVKGGRPTIFDLTEAPQALREAMGDCQQFAARFELPVREKEVYLSRTHPYVEGLASYVVESAFDRHGKGPASRAGAIRSNKVSTRTVLLLLRLRFHITTKRPTGEQTLLAEDCKVAAFRGSPQKAEWLPDPEAMDLLRLQSDGNIPTDVATHHLRSVLDDLHVLTPSIEAIARRSGEQILLSHQRVRAAARLRNVSYKIEPQFPADVLGIYLYLPLKA